MGAAEGEEMNPVEDESNLVEGETDTNLAKVEEKYPAGQVTSSTSEKTQVSVDTDEATSEGGNAVIKKDQTEKDLLVVAQEDDWQAHLRVEKKQVPNELERYMAEDLFPPSKDFDILGWWELHGPKYPVLACIARDVLAIQASTVPSESSFSAGGRIITDHRSRLKSEMVEALICLQDWLKAADPKLISKDVEEEDCLVFYQVSECHEETAANQAKVNPDTTSENQLT